MPNSNNSRLIRKTTKAGVVNQTAMKGSAMTIELSIIEMLPPRLQFGGASTHSDPKVGLLAAGPFDLRFGSARKDHVHVGIIGPADQVAAARRWLDRCGQEVPVLGE